jgi:hypothetical protein
MPGNGRCARYADVTDEEILVVHRGAFTHKTGKGLVMDFGDGCVLAERHGGDCAAHVGSLGGYPASAWVRASESGRRLDWLADCPADGCALFLGHPGDCDPCGVPDGNRRWPLGLPLDAMRTPEVPG